MFEERVEPRTLSALEMHMPSRSFAEDRRLVRSALERFYAIGIDYFDGDLKSGGMIADERETNSSRLQQTSPSVAHEDGIDG